MARIAFCGAQGTGKTTLVEELFKLPQFQQYKRYTNVQRTLHNYLGDKFPHSSKTNDISQASISSNFVLQLLNEENLICDRSLLDTFGYATIALNVKHSEDIEEVFNKGLELYDVIFYLPKEFEVDDDGFRDSNKHYVNQIDAILKQYVEKYKDKVKIVEVRGSITERMDIILKTLEG